MNNDNYILVIGGSNVDITGFSGGIFKAHDSNPGTIKMSPGGVGRNIAENTARLGIETKLLTAVGGDNFGSFLFGECTRVGIDMSQAKLIKTAATSTYAAIMDEKGDLAAAVSDMGITAEINSDMLEKNSDLIESAEIVITDNNISPETLKTLIKMRNGNILFDAVSGRKLMRVIDLIQEINTVKLNSIEAGILAGISIDSPEDLVKAAKIISERQIDNIFITMGAGGSIYLSGDNIWRQQPKPLEITNSTGAGDAFMAGVAYGMFKERRGQALLKTASICASFAAASEKTVADDLSASAIENIFQGDRDEF